MPLVNLLNVPKTPVEWDIWSFSHRDSHTKILQAIRAQKSVDLPEYQLDPISPEDFQGFLDRNAQSHIDFNGFLGTQGSDLRELDPRDENKLSAWIESHFLEHQTAETSLKI